MSRKRPTRVRRTSGSRTRSAGGRARTTGGSSPNERADFLARAWGMEVEAAERYASFADAMDEHNNHDVAELFRKLARIEQLHADQLLEGPLAGRPPVLPPGGIRWKGGEGPETAEHGELHYRMQPYHALQIALACEKRANKFFATYASRVSDARLRDTAREMAAEEMEHVHLIEEWLERTPPPEKDWEHDPDPPLVSD